MTERPQIKPRVSGLFKVAVTVALLSAAANLASAQTTSASDKMTPLGLAPGSPTGSYALSGFDNINLYNGNLNFRLPQISIGGRGEVAVLPMLALNVKSWRVKRISPPPDFGTPTYVPTQNSWYYSGPLGGIRVAASLLGRQSGLYTQNCLDSSQHTRKLYQYTTTTLTLTLPDGTEYEFRDQSNLGKPLPMPYSWGGPCPSLNQGAARGTTWVTVDGTAATFVSDTTIYDTAFAPTGFAQNGYTTITPSGYLMLRDGTRYRIDGGAVMWMRDRNGNRLSFSYDPTTRVTTVTDSLNRQVTITYADFVTVFSDQISYKGFGGAPRTITINYTALANALRAGYAIQTIQQLFPELNGSSSSTTYNPNVVASVTLPNNQQYQFRYNSYGELARVTLPTGGAVEYDMTPGSGVVQAPSEDFQIYRRVVERRIYADGITLTGKTTYSASQSGPGDAQPLSTTITVDQLTPAGALLARSKHYFYGSGLVSLFQTPSRQIYSAWDEGKEYQTEAIDTNGTTILRRTVNTFQQRAPVWWWVAWYGSAANEPANDPRLTQAVSTLVDTNQVSQNTFSYDQFNNITDTYEYDYGSGTAGALVRRRHTDYLTTNPVNGVDYTATSIHLRGLPAQQQIFDAGGAEKSRTTFEYDNYVNDGNHAPLWDRPGISGLDSSFTTGYLTRGNLTRVTNWILSTSTQLNSYSQYDIAGNVVKVIDARGYATVLGYSDRFGAPDGDALSNVPPAELAGQTSYAFATSVTNAQNQTAYGQFDYYLGLPVDGQDLNGIVASGYYNDVLDRPTQIIRAANQGAPVKGQSTFSYDDTNRIVTVTGDLTIYGDNLLKSQTLYDGLGRTTETRSYEGSTNYIAAQKQYDALGRAYRGSNPFRPWQSETAIWTTSAFDALGRVTSVTTPDNAVGTSSYLGNAVTVTDQAGKARKSLTDALGRLTSVYEDPAGLNYQTSYSYDVLDDLTTVSQGVQTRTFIYDSLKRLTSTSNPETGTVSYPQYDNNGNLLSKTDARGVTTNFAYDALNRVTSKTYQNDPSGTPAVNYYYDSQALPTGAPTFDRGYSTGRLVALTYGGGSSGDYTEFDALGRTPRKIQQTDSVNYLTEASYNVSGAMTSETYPNVPGYSDRRTVSYSFDSAGRLSSLSSSATTYAPAANVSSIGYASHNALNTESYGGLLHIINYNNRLQPTEIKLATTGKGSTTLIDLVYNYGATNNNGNVQYSTYSGGGLSYTQTFSYDALNRLSTATETSGGSTSWSQTNAYDRYGNRQIDYGGGSYNVSFSATTNRITTSGFGYDASGNLTNDTLKSYTYDGEGHIKTVNATTAYVYDGSGARVRKLVGENTRFVYGIGGELIMEFDGSSGNLKKEYVYGGATLITIEPTALNSNGTQYSTADHLGSPRVITNSSASVVARHDYMPFGEELFAGTGGRTTGMGYGSTGETNRKKFTSKERDIETGLDYFVARYYSSTQGRFTSSDPIFIAIERLHNPQGLNLYSYTFNNPLRFIDPTGMEVRIKCETEKQCQAIVEELNSREGAGFKVKLDKNGVVQVVGGANKVDISKLSDAEKQLLGAITDKKNVAELTVRPTGDKLDQILFDKFEGFKGVENGKNVATHLFDSRDMQILDEASKVVAGNMIGHAILEAMAASREKLGPIDFSRAHRQADPFFEGLNVGKNAKRTNSPDGSYRLDATFLSIGKVVEIRVSNFNGGGRVTSVNVRPLEKKP